MCLCKCTMLSCLSILLIMLNPGGWHSQSSLSTWAFAAALRQGTGFSTCSLSPHTRTHTCQVTPKRVTKRRKHFCLARKANNYPTSVYVCENVREKGEREWEQQRKKEKEGKTHTIIHIRRHTHTCISDTKKEEIKQHFLCLEIQNCHEAMIENDYKEAYTDHWTATQFKTHRNICSYSLFFWLPLLPISPLLSSLPLISPHFSFHQKGIRENIFHQLLILFLLCHDKVTVCCLIPPTHAHTLTHTYTTKVNLMLYAGIWTCTHLKLFCSMRINTHKWVFTHRTYLKTQNSELLAASSKIHKNQLIN